MIKINNKKVNKIVINGKEVEKIIINNAIKYQKASPTTFTINFTAPVTIGNTTTSSGGLMTSYNTWTQIDNTISYYTNITNINRQTSGQPNIPYDTNIHNAKFIQINQLAFKNTTTTKRTGCYVQIYDYNSPSDIIYDSRLDGDEAFTLPNNTSNAVYLTPSTPPVLEPSKTYAINVYTYSFFATYRAATVILNNYDIAPGDAS